MTFSYAPGLPAIGPLSLQVEQGERLVILGPNGCGKSTLQKILAGLLFPQSGRFAVRDRLLKAEDFRDPDFAAAYHRRVGYLFQNPDVQLFCASVRDEILFGPLAAGVPAEEAGRRVDELIALLGLQALTQRLPQRLSGGEKKKVALAAILINHPEVLILDEPTNGLDPRSQGWMLGFLHELRRAGKTIIIATHQLELVPDLADRVIVLGERHQLLAEGSPQEILENQELLLAANLIGPGQHVHIHGEDGHVHVHRHR